MTSSRTIKVAPGVLVVLTAIALVLPARTAEARGSIPVIVQLTTNTTGTVEDPRIRSMDGQTVVFTSDGDVLGPSNGTKEVYYYDFETGIMQQVTNNAAHNSDQAARSTDLVFAAGRPAHVALVSTDNLDSDGIGPGGAAINNLDGNPEIYLWEHDTGIFHQLTDTAAPVVNANPYVSDSGKCIVFDSNGDMDNNDNTDDQAPPTGFTNPDGSREVFIHHVTTSNDFPNEGMFTQVSNGPSGTTSWRPVIGGYWFPRQCQSTVYMSDHDQAGGSRVGTHIYVWHRPSATNQAMDAPKEIPNGQPDGNYLYPHISSASPFARGPFTVFETTADLWNNGSSGSEMFRYRIFHPRMTQYSDVEIGDVTRPVVSDGGGVIAFEGNGEHVNPAKKIRPETLLPPLNPDNNKEIFWQKGRRKMTQVTMTSGCDNELPSIRDDGTAVAFRSTCDLVPGHNTGGLPQVFVWKLVKSSDPLACIKSDKPCECTIANRCCNEANGCLDHIKGRTIRPKKKNCLDKPSGC